MGSALNSALKSTILTLPEASPVNVLIAYDEVCAGRQGTELFYALESEASGGRELHCDLWRFDLIGLPGLHQTAILAAMHARIIIVATSADVDLPTPVKDWLDQSFARKSPGSAAVIALLHSARAGLSNSPSRSTLEFMAYRRKLHFFGTAAESMKQEAPPPESVPEEPSEGPSRLQDIVNRHPRPPRWGINE